MLIIFYLELQKCEYEGLFNRLSQRGAIQLVLPVVVQTGSFRTACCMPQATGSNDGHDGEVAAGWLHHFTAAAIGLVSIFATNL